MNSRILVYFLSLSLLTGCGGEKQNQENSKYIPEARENETLQVDELAAVPEPKGSIPEPAVSMGNEDIQKDENALRNLYLEDAPQRKAGTESNFIEGGVGTSNSEFAEAIKFSMPVFRDGVFVGSISTDDMSLDSIHQEDSGKVFATRERITGYDTFRIPRLAHDRIMAERGDAEAQFTMGVRYLQGEEVPKDMGEAFNWFLKSAEQGLHLAQFNLGLMYNKGEGVEQNLEEAAYWYSRSAEHDNPRAQNNLGLMYLFGEGVEQDTDKAIDWISRSATLGNPKAQFNLGNLYNIPETSFSDNSMAVYLWTLAANQGHAMAQTNLVLAHLDDSGVAYDPYKAYKWAYIANKMDPEDTVIQEQLQTALYLLYMPDFLRAEEEAEAWLARFGDAPLP